MMCKTESANELCIANTLIGDKINAGNNELI